MLAIELSSSLNVSSVGDTLDFAYSNNQPLSRQTILQVGILNDHKVHVLGGFVSDKGIKAIAEQFNLDQILKKDLSSLPDPVFVCEDVKLWTKQQLLSSVRGNCLDAARLMDQLEDHIKDL
ncbi:MAG: hypothetical protein EOP04_30045 [Proteobacteria bacterium]|nr:MAG: hypothetical protein EOP04_30045 [Pseudomonadota bacterium]